MCAREHPDLLSAFPGVSVSQIVFDDGIVSIFGCERESRRWGWSVNILESRLGETLFMCESPERFLQWEIPSQQRPHSHPLFLSQRWCPVNPKALYLRETSPFVSLRSVCWTWTKSHLGGWFFIWSCPFQVRLPLSAFCFHLFSSGTDNRGSRASASL